MAAEVTIGNSKYTIAEDGNPNQIGGADQFVVVSDDSGRPILVERNGKSVYVTYQQKRAARATALNLTKFGLPARVHEKPS